MAVSTPLFQLGFKADPAPHGQEHLRQELTGDLLCEVLAGSSSPLYAKLYREGLINKDFSGGYAAYPGCAFLSFGGESRDPAAVRDAVLSEAARLAREGVDEALFLRLKKASYGAAVRGLNSFEYVCIQMAQDHFAGADHMDFPAVYESIRKEDVEDALRRWCVPERAAMAVIRPKEGV